MASSTFDITIQGLVPVPLKDKLEKRPSDIWNNRVTFAAGSRVKVVAPSGTGKTTLMNILYKLRHDYEGGVDVGNSNLKAIADDALATLRQQKVSVIFQDLRLFDQLTAWENIELNRVLQQPYYDATMIDALAERLGITHILQQRTGLCSYGEQQRIAIVRALVQPFEWLLMDEPFSHLDKANAQKAMDLIAEECDKRNAGFILTDLDDDNLYPYTNTYHL